MEVTSRRPAKRAKIGPKRKPYSRARVANTISSVRVPGAPGFPDEFICKLVYVANGTFSGGSPTPSAQVFDLGSLYDPDVSSTGHQPKYFDELQAIYGKYLVFGVKYEVEFNNGASTPAYAVLAINETNIGANTVEALQEARYARNVNLGSINGSNIQLVKGYMSLSKLHGQAHRDSDPNQYAAINASPPDGSFMILKAMSCDGVSNANVYWKAKLIYYCKFKDLQDPGQS